ncbi:MAG: hypothetical protein ACYTEL_24875 [Planctomycetota bacterium]|jgi:hypothetical protein
MADMDRTIQELLVDYADALRDGCIPSFLKSLTREEGQLLTSSRQFWDAAEMVRTVNSAGFADKAVTPNVSLFFSRVNAEIASRLKKAKRPARAGHTSDTRHASQREKTEKQI